MLKNYYRRLGVRLTASAAEIKKAYHAAARERHPDVSTGSIGDFVDLQEAYDVLSDPAKRAEYDRTRQEWARLNGAFVCSGCGTPNFVSRRPRPDEQVICSYCQVPLPLDIPTAVGLQKQRLVAEAARVVDDVGAELATTAIDLARDGLARLRRRWKRS